MDRTKRLTLLRIRAQGKNHFYTNAKYMYTRTVHGNEDHYDPQQVWSCWQLRNYIKSKTRQITRVSQPPVPFCPGTQCDRAAA